VVLSVRLNFSISLNHHDFAITAGELSRPFGLDAGVVGQRPQVAEQYACQRSSVHSQVYSDAPAFNSLCDIYRSGLRWHGLVWMLVLLLCSSNATIVLDHLPFTSQKAYPCPYFDIPLDGINAI